MIRWRRYWFVKTHGRMIKITRRIMMERNPLFCPLSMLIKWAIAILESLS
jgi:hypothetical protein